MIEGVLFDVDGLLVDSEPCWTAARRQLATETGQDWTDDDKRACMGVSTREWSSYMIRRLGLGLSPGEVEARIIGFIKAEYARAIPFLPGAIEAVRLASLHFRVGIASGSHRDLVDAVADDPRLRGKFAAVAYADDVAAGKPKPDVYLAAARKLNLAPGSCACLEDSANGILAGVAAGMKVIAVPDPAFPPPAAILAKADRVLASLTEVDLHLLRGL